MKKVIVSFIIFFISVSVLSFDYNLNKQLTSILYDNHQEMIINFQEMKGDDSRDFIQALKEFSIEEEVNISQYNFLNDDTLHVYATNITRDPYVQLISGSWPNTDKYISNKTEMSNKQIGSVAFPISNWEVRYYDIDQVRNLGVGETYYLPTHDKDLIERAVQTFSTFGEVRIQEVHTNPRMMINVTLILMVLFGLVILCINTIYYLVRNRAQLYLHQLWGYSLLRSFATILGSFFKHFLIIIIAGGMIVATLTVLFHQMYYFLNNVLVYIAIVLTTLIVMITIFGLGIFFIHQSGLSGSNLKGKPPFKNYQLASVGLKVLVSISLLAIIGSSFAKVMDLNQQVKDQSYWNATQNMYRIIVGPFNTDGDLEKERYVFDRLANLYQILKKEIDVFLIYAANFTMIEHKGKVPQYLYEWNTEGEEQFYMPHGRSIIINENYLKINPIIAANEHDILSQIDDNSMVLNILVPEKLKKYETLIKRYYQERFYFQKVRVDNIYNEEIGLPLNYTSIEELGVNIIYTKDDQMYFTFNSRLGDPKNKNNIIDPIAIIYNDSVDTSFIGAFTTTSLYFYDDSQGGAYNRIIQYLEESDTQRYIPFVASVYQERNAEIVRLKQDLIQQVIALVMMMILSLAFLFVFIWSYYMSNAYKLYLQYLFGYSYWKRNKLLLLNALAIHLLAGIIVFLWLQSIVIIVCMLALITIELFLVYLLGNYLNQQNIGKIHKGENI